MDPEEGNVLWSLNKLSLEPTDNSLVTVETNADSYNPGDLVHAQISSRTVPTVDPAYSHMSYDLNLTAHKASVTTVNDAHNVRVTPATFPCKPGCTDSFMPPAWPADLTNRDPMWLNTFHMADSSAPGKAGWTSRQNMYRIYAAFQGHMDLTNNIPLPPSTGAVGLWRRVIARTNDGVNVETQERMDLVQAMKHHYTRLPNQKSNEALLQCGTSRLDSRGGVRPETYHNKPVVGGVKEPAVMLERLNPGSPMTALRIDGRQGGPELDKYRSAATNVSNPMTWGNAFKFHQCKNRSNHSAHYFGSYFESAGVAAGLANRDYYSAFGNLYQIIELKKPGTQPAATDVIPHGDVEGFKGYCYGVGYGTVDPGGSNEHAFFLPVLDPVGVSDPIFNATPNTVKCFSNFGHGLDQVDGQYGVGGGGAADSPITLLGSFLDTNKLYILKPVEGIGYDFTCPVRHPVPSNWLTYPQGNTFYVSGFGGLRYEWTLARANEWFTNKGTAMYSRALNSKGTTISYKLSKTKMNLRTLNPSASMSDAMEQELGSQDGMQQDSIQYSLITRTVPQGVTEYTIDLNFPHQRVFCLFAIPEFNGSGVQEHTSRFSENKASVGESNYYQSFLDSVSIEHNLDGFGEWQWSLFQQREPSYPISVGSIVKSNYGGMQTSAVHLQHIANALGNLNLPLADARNQAGFFVIPRRLSASGGFVDLTAAATQLIIKFTKPTPEAFLMHTFAAIQTRTTSSKSGGTIVAQ